MNDLPLFALVKKKADEEQSKDLEREKASASLPDAALEKLKSLNPDDLTPREALDALYELKKLAGVSK